MPMDYFVWVAKGGGRTFAIDIGFNAEASESASPRAAPVEALAALGIDDSTPYPEHVVPTPICITTMSRNFRSSSHKL